MQFENELNPPQLEAVLHTEGPLLILAGAGSGKTRVITYRIGHLIRDLGVDPWAILAVTFTNKAAREMNARVEALIGRGLPNLWIGTFHGVCARMLRQEAPAIGFRNPFSIYDESESLSVIKKVVSGMELDPRVFEPKRIAWKIDRLKNKGLLPDDPWEEDDRTFDSRFRQIYLGYQERLKQSNAMDFGDLILHIVKLFERDPAARSRWQRAFSYLLVDEYQDTNYVQYRFVRYLAEGHGNVAVVGDDDQSIYSWRGANSANLRHFEEDFPRLKTVKLEQNYRSTAPILKAASSLISRNRDRKDKTLWTEQTGGRPLRFFLADDEIAESEFVIGEIGRLHREEDRELHEFAVFYRTNAQSRVLEEQLLRRNIPYVVIGGMRFYDRAEIKDALAYARLALNPADDEAFLRVVNTPARGIGQSTVEQLSRFARERNLPLLAACRPAMEAGVLKPAAAKRLARFIAIMGDLETSVGTPDVRVFLEKVLKGSGLVDAFEGEDTPEAEARLENLGELLNAAEEFVKRTPEPSVSLFLERVGLLSQADTAPDYTDRVTLMTVHMAKGLEFPVVFLTGLEEGLFPLERAALTREDLEEERRLAYVGITRARELLYLSCAEMRRSYGNTYVRDPSRFIGEIPQAVIEVTGAGGHPLKRRPPLRSRFDDSGDIPADDDDGVPDNLPDAEDDGEARGDAGGGRRSGTRAVLRKGAARSETASPFQVNTKVDHPVFGPGIITEKAKVNGQELVTVRFAKAGEKKMMVRFANLTVLPSARS